MNLDGSFDAFAHPAGLWAAVVAFGLCRGLNPAMGWPLAVANAMAQRRDGALLRTLAPLGAGHVLAMASALLPFALLAPWVEHGRAVRLAAGATVFGFGVYRLVLRRHPRTLARIAPARLVWWSFMMATAHGAGLMLAPLALGLCSAADVGATPMDRLMRDGLGTALAVALVHTVAMLAAGLAIAALVFRWLGLGALHRLWAHLDAVWGSSLALAGAASIALAWG